MFKQFGKVICGIVVMAICINTIAVPVQAAEDEEIVEMVTPDADEEIESTIPLVSLSNEDLVLSEEVALCDEVSGEQVEQFDVFSQDFQEEEAQFNATSTYYNNQPEFFVNSGFDCLQFYIMQNNEVAGKAYFIIVNPGLKDEMWMLYNYKEENAKRYFSNYELLNGMYVPSIKSDKRVDRTETAAINESRVPVMTMVSYNTLYCNWRGLADIPFNRDSASNIQYATYTGESPSDDGGSTDGGTTTGDITEAKLNAEASKWYRYTVSGKSGNVYRVYITKSVEFCGKKHVLTTSKTKKVKKDIQIYVFANGDVVKKSLYSVKFKNNLNCNGYKDKTPYVMFTFKFKNPSLKADKKQLGKLAFGFDITPVDLTKGVLTCTVKTTKSGALKLKNPKFVTNNNVAISMKAGRDYKLSISGNNVIVTGTYNFKNTYTVKTNGGGGGIY